MRVKKFVDEVFNAKLDYCLLCYRTAKERQLVGSRQYHVLLQKLPHLSTKKKSKMHSKHVCFVCAALINKMLNVIDMIVWAEKVATWVSGQTSGIPPDLFDENTEKYQKFTRIITTETLNISSTDVSIGSSQTGEDPLNLTPNISNVGGQLILVPTNNGVQILNAQPQMFSNNFQILNSNPVLNNIQGLNNNVRGLSNNIQGLNSNILLNALNGNFQVMNTPQTSTHLLNGNFHSTLNHTSQSVASQGFSDTSQGSTTQSTKFKSKGVKYNKEGATNASKGSKNSVQDAASRVALANNSVNKIPSNMDQHANRGENSQLMVNDNMDCIAIIETDITATAGCNEGSCIVPDDMYIIDSDDSQEDKSDAAKPRIIPVDIDTLKQSNLGTPNQTHNDTEVLNPIQTGSAILNTSDSANFVINEGSDVPGALKMNGKMLIPMACGENVFYVEMTECVVDAATQKVILNQTVKSSQDAADSSQIVIQLPENEKGDKDKQILIEQSQLQNMFDLLKNKFQEGDAPIESPETKKKQGIAWERANRGPQTPASWCNIAPKDLTHRKAKPTSKNPLNSTAIKPNQAPTNQNMSNQTLTKQKQSNKTQGNQSSYFMTNTNPKQSMLSEIEISDDDDEETPDITTLLANQMSENIAKSKACFGRPIVPVPNTADKREVDWEDQIPMEVITYADDTPMPLEPAPMGVISDVYSQQGRTHRNQTKGAKKRPRRGK